MTLIPDSFRRRYLMQHPGRRLDRYGVSYGRPGQFSVLRGVPQDQFEKSDAYQNDLRQRNSLMREYQFAPPENAPGTHPFAPQPQHQSVLPQVLALLQGRRRAPAAEPPVGGAPVRNVFPQGQPDYWGIVNNAASYDARGISPLGRPQRRGVVE